MSVNQLKLRDKELEEFKEMFAPVTNDLNENMKKSTNKAICDLFEAAVAGIKAHHAAAKAIYEIAELTGKSYEIIAKCLIGMSGGCYAKSTVSKLYKVGKVLKAFPALSEIKDTEKLYMISRLQPEDLIVLAAPKTSEKINKIDLVKCSRQTVKDLLESKLTKTSVKSVNYQIQKAIKLLKDASNELILILPELASAIDIIIEDIKVSA